MSDLTALQIVVGEWSMQARWPDQPPAEGDARVTFEWMTGEQFLVQRWSVDAPEAPDGIAIIGPNPAHEGEYLQHYFDSRGVARVYRMTLTDGVLTFWRDDADLSPLDFRQRYRGTISADGQAINGAWEICHDGTTWEHDFELNYQRGASTTPRKPTAAYARAMANVVEVHADSRAAPEAVWQLLSDVTTWPSWSNFDETSYEREGEPAPHGLGAVRRLRIKKLKSSEEVLAFDPPRHFAYDYVGSLPFKSYRGDVMLTPSMDGDGGTHITWHSEFEPKYPGTGWAMRAFMKKVLTDVSASLAKAAESPTDA